MFGTHALPPPSTFTNDRQFASWMSGEVSRPQPTGSCQSYVSHASSKDQRCACQSFHQNHSTPGNVCDCGHQACYHIHSPPSSDGGQGQDKMSSAIEKILSERIKHLEEMIQQERIMRENAIQRERQLWEREARMLREALTPFYKSEQEMRRKQVELEDKLEGNYDEQIRVRDMIVALDDANMLLEKKFEEMEVVNNKKRKISRSTGLEESSIKGGGWRDAARLSVDMDERPGHSSCSRDISPNSGSQLIAEPEEARSSGVLNLLDAPRPVPHVMAKRELPSPPQEEPRSSGFLALDLTERIQAQRAARQKAHDNSSINGQNLAHLRSGPPGFTGWNENLGREQRSPSSASVSNSVSSHEGMRNSKRRSPMDRGALDVLANVSVASPMAH